MPYKTMSKDELLSFPINDFANENCFLWLWTTNSKDRKTKEPFFKTSFDLLEKWGFEFYTMITWNKNTGTCPFGPYQITSEYVIFAYKGKVKFNKNCLGKMKTIFESKRTVHSEKPDLFFEMINKYFEGNKIEIFARKKRIGFDGWGDEYNIEH